MMTLEQLSRAAVNPMAARQAEAHAEKRLGDLLDAKDSFETKASTFFTVYIGIALALFGGGGAIFQAEKSVTALVISLWVTGAAYVIGAVSFVMALRRQKYGVAGGDPELWLREGVIDGDERSVGYNLAYITFYYKSRIDASELSNRTKARWIETGIWTGIAAPIGFVVLVLLFTGLFR